MENKHGEVIIKTFPVRMSLEMNEALRKKAATESVTIHQLVLKALSNILNDRAV